MNNYYDKLFADLEGTKIYYDFLKEHIKGETLIELASGTGDLLNLLSQDYQVFGIDLDETMLKSASLKYPHLENKMELGDFLSYHNQNQYDTLICVGDSLNYILNERDLDKFVNTSLSLSNHIILDFHHPYRLDEFQDGYFEEGIVDDLEYLYNIEIEDELIVHTINFLDGQYTQVIQWVFDPFILINKYIEKGYKVNILSDFENEGITEKGEKIMLIISKGDL